MKYVTYQAGGGARVGRLDGATVVDVGFEGDMTAFIEAGAPAGPERPVPDARLLAPIRPRSLRDFLAFEGHLKNAFKNLGREIPAEWYEVPAFYRSVGDTVIGPDVELPWPSYTRQLDHELELAAVIGRPCRDVSAAEALDYVFGFTIWNDMSARDVQRRELPVGMGPAKAKEWDGSNVLGPCIVTTDEIDLATLQLEVRVNGERWGGDTTANMHHTSVTSSPTPPRTRPCVPATCWAPAPPPAAPGWSWTVGSAPATSSRWRPARSASCATPSAPPPPGRTAEMAYVVAATWKAKPGEADRITEVIRIMTPLSRQEPGNLFYQAQVSPDEPETFFLYEQYTDAQAYEDHKNSEHFQKHVFGYAIDYLAERSVKTYQTIDV